MTTRAFQSAYLSAICGHGTWQVARKAALGSDARHEDNQKKDATHQRLSEERNYRRELHDGVLDEREGERARALRAAGY